jgi:hypothetical protein
MKKISLGCVSFLAGTLLALEAQAGPTLIRDSRIQDLSTTPVLGRGYSLSTNTFQSTCLKDVVITDPSYDFQYLFKEVESSSESSSDFAVSANASYSYFWVSATVESSAKYASKRGQTAHNILVTLNMDTYYGSVNEAGTPLSDAAASLLTNHDILGFFSACGPYYTRGITRNAQFVSIFTYETKTSQRDAAFEAALQVQLRGFSGGNFGSSVSGSFSEQASSRNLTITSRGWGMGKDAEAALISYDLESFKGAIKHAFTSMQNPLTGRVTSIEVVPWVENSEFQNTLSLRGEDVIDGKEVPLYEKKDILTFNGEFLTEAERAARLRLNMYYKAKVCKNHIVGNYYQNGRLDDKVARRQLKNHRMAKPGITLAEMDTLLSDAEVQNLWKAYEDFSHKGKPNMTSCINELFADPATSMAPGTPPIPGTAGVEGLTPGVMPNMGLGRGLFLRRYSAIKTCADLQKNFAAALSEKIEDHCMPELL